MEVKNSEIEKEIESIWQMGHDMGISDLEIDKIVYSALEEHKRKTITPINNLHTAIKFTKSILKIFLIVNILIVAVGIAVGTVISLHNPTKKFITRNFQDMIYPFITELRHTTLPVLQKFPQLSTWYTEECLINNPFYSPGENDCSVCSGTISVQRKLAIKNFDSYANSGRLVILPDALQRQVLWTDFLKEINITEEKELGVWKSNMEEHPNIDHMPKNFHIDWRIDKLKSLHIVRDHFPRPYFISGDSEVALHRNIYIDGPHAESYDIPSLEFTNILLIQGHGSSTFLLNPSYQCKDLCNPVKVTLLPKEALFYNFIYWQPIRLHSSSEDVSLYIIKSFY
ncbi:unnamed protein product [Meganyctiphanes norvegica]|uniref:Uncharacterized protein n=1 Tax=Meganyctiphanes norvegica TaxID=48144 RepID=A0AAV2RDM4_MEGNR